jgi:hypothetical protein
VPVLVPVPVRAPVQVQVPAQVPVQAQVPVPVQVRVQVQVKGPRLEPEWVPVSWLACRRRRRHSQPPGSP